jgi:acyl-coenzyme A thioesterase PaaI-like protein
MVTVAVEIPVGFEPHTRKSPLIAPWQPIYISEDANSVVLGMEIREPHTNSRGLVHGGLVASMLDNVMGLACGKAHAAKGYGGTGGVTLSLSVEYLGMARTGHWITFEPHFVKAGKLLCFAEASAIADGAIIARAKSTYRMGIAG